MEWTSEQKDTIEIKGKNILVSAAAGSGKTTVLVERIKNLVINEGADIDRFLITTYTKAAAAEMKTRLEKAFRNAGLSRQLQKLPAASIGTFHSFAIEIIRQYFYLTDLEPGFSIADDVQMAIMKKDALDEVFAGRYEQDYENFREFLLKYSKGKGDARLKDNILETYRTLVSIPDYMNWARNKAELIGNDNPMEALGAYNLIASDVSCRIEEAKQKFEKAAEILNTDNTPKLYQKAISDIVKITELTDKANRVKKSEDVKKGLEELKESINKLKFATLSAGKDEKDYYDDEIKTSLKKQRDAGKKIIKEIANDYFSKPFEAFDQDLKDVYPDTLYYIGIIEEFIDVLKSAKAEAAVIDFDDVMHYAIEILKSDQAASELREKFDYIFIDEYQDSNYLQEEIVKRIVRDNNLFMVGDVKQCIYKFRLAEPELFEDKARLYSEENEDKSILLNLNSNFRSKKNVTEPINDLFRQVMKGYDESAELHCTAPADYPGMPARIHIINRENFDEAAPDKGEAEAAVIAEIIRQHLGQEIYDTKTNAKRKLRLADFAVIARNNHTVEEIERYLINDGIEAYGEGSGEYYETVEVQVFLNILRIIENMRQDIALISAMRSVVFGFSTRELVEIRTQKRDGNFYSSVMAYAENGRNIELCKKINAMIDKINLWKEVSRTVALEDLMKTILYDTGYYDYCSGLPVGLQRISNLRLIAEKAARYEEICHGGLFGFLKYIETMTESGKNDSEAKVLNESENVVRVMSVHKSKGLEFPVVIFANASRRTSNNGTGNAITIHRDCGIGLPKVNRKEHWYRKTFLQKMISKTAGREAIEEEIRILYVALTRAKDCIEIVGSVSKEDNLPEEVSTGTFLDMIYAPFTSRDEVDVVEYVDADALNQAHENKMHKVSELFEAADSIKNKEPGREGSMDGEAYRFIDRNLSYVYHADRDALVKPKYSVSELNGSREISNEIYLDQFRPDDTETDISFAQVGTAMHLIMEKANFKRAAEANGCGIIGREYLQELADGLLVDKTITVKQYDAINLEKAYLFFKTDVGKRAANAYGLGKLQKEKEFILEKKINGVNTVVQGIIDCYFEENGKLILIDYKNSYMGGGRSKEEITETYRQQIELYKEALQGATGMKVEEAYLYMFETGEFIKI